jgi:membrane protease YdiL (CAAX protease family)
VTFQPRQRILDADCAEPQSSAGRWGPWATLAWAAGGAAVWITAQLTGAVLFLIWWQHTTGEPLRLSQIGTHGPAIAFAVLLATPFLFAYLYLATRLARARFDEYLALRLPRGRHTFGAVLVLIGLIVLASFADAGAGKDMPPFVLESFRSARDAGMLPLLIFAFVILAPLQEEVMFRGFIYRGLSSGFGPLVTVVLTAGVWALLHGQYEWYFVLQIFVLGLYFGWVRWMSGSTLLPFFLHALINGTAIAQAAARI